MPKKTGRQARQFSEDSSSMEVDDALEDEIGLEAEERDELEDDVDDEEQGHDEEEEDELGEEGEGEEEEEEEKKRQGISELSEEEDEDEDEDDEDDDLEQSLTSREGSETPARLTKRQRARIQGGEVGLLALPTGGGKRVFRTEEEIALKRSETARKRKNLTIQKAEKDKMDTINRLLKKQASKKRTTKEDEHEENTPSPPSKLHYVRNATGATLSLPMGTDWATIIPSKPPTARVPGQCDVEGCLKERKYTLVSGKRACSLEHYRLL